MSQPRIAKTTIAQALAAVELDAVERPHRWEYWVRQWERRTKDELVQALLSRADIITGRGWRGPAKQADLDELVELSFNFI